MGTENEWKIYIAAWGCAMVAACVGTYFTQSPWCLCVMILPTMMGSTGDKNKKKKKDEEKQC